MFSAPRDLQIIKATLTLGVRVVCVRSTCKIWQSSTIHVRATYVFWWTQRRRTARSHKTGRPVFRCDKSASFRTQGARLKHARQTYWVSRLGVRVTHGKYEKNPGCFTTKTYLPSKCIVRVSYVQLALDVRVDKNVRLSYFWSALGVGTIHVTCASCRFYVTFLSMRMNPK